MLKTDLVPRKTYYHVVSDGTLVQVLVYTLNDTKNDFKRYVAATSHGLTSIGMQYLNPSVEGYTFSTPLYMAQVSQDAAEDLWKQQKFRNVAEDSVINYTIST